MYVVEKETLNSFYCLSAQLNKEQDLFLAPKTSDSISIDENQLWKGQNSKIKHNNTHREFMESKSTKDQGYTLL